MIKCAFSRKSFHLFKSLLYKNGRAQNTLVVAGRLVAIAAEKAWGRHPKLQKTGNLANYRIL